MVGSEVWNRNQSGWRWTVDVDPTRLEWGGGGKESNGGGDQYSMMKWSS